MDRRSLDVKAGYTFVDDLFFLLPADMQRIDKLMNNRDAHVEGNRILQDQSFQLSVLGHQAKTHLLNVERRHLRDIFSLEGNFSRRSRVQAHD